MPASAILPLIALLAQPQAARPRHARVRARARRGARGRESEAGRDKKEEKEEPPVVTHHELRAGGRVLKYTATTGLMPLKERGGRPRGAHLLRRVHARPRRRARREAAAHVLVQRRPGLVVGLAAPRRPRAEAREDEGRRHDAGAPVRARGQRGDVAHGDGSRLHRPRRDGLQPRRQARARKEVLGVEGDIASVGEFIRLYLARNERWASPLFLVGESYGTTRAAGLSGAPRRQGHRLQRHPARLVDPELPDGPVHEGQRPSLPALPPDLHGDGLVPQEAPGRPAGESPFAPSSTRSRSSPAADYPVALAKGDALTRGGAQGDRRAARALHRPRPGAGSTAPT